MCDGAFLLRICLRREHDVRLFAQRVGQEGCVGDDRPSPTCGWIYAEQVEAAQLASLERLGDPLRIEPACPPEGVLVDLAELRSGVGEHARLAQAAAVGV